MAKEYKCKKCKAVTYDKERYLKHINLPHPAKK